MVVEMSSRKILRQFVVDETADGIVSSLLRIVPILMHPNQKNRCNHQHEGSERACFEHMKNCKLKR